MKARQHEMTDARLQIDLLVPTLAPPAPPALPPFLLGLSGPCILHVLYPVPQGSLRLEKVKADSRLVDIIERVQLRKNQGADVRSAQDIQHK